jgi:magnesium chelatase family protein
MQKRLIGGNLMASHNAADLLGRDHTLYGGILVGMDGHIITIQARAMKVIKNGGEWLRDVKITGMARPAAESAIYRIAGAFAKNGIPDPNVEIMINLAPADLPKEGAMLDLPLAVIMLQAAGILPDLHEDQEWKFVLVGELGLHGEIRRVPGILSMAHITQPGQMLLVPSGNEKECSLIMTTPGHEGCKIASVATFKEVFEYFLGKSKLANALAQEIKYKPFLPECIDMGRIKGQRKAKEGALIAAAGGHNLLLVGPPGEGKSLLASAIPGILPRLSNQAMVELTRIYSVAGMLEEDGLIVSRRPMRSVHHSASKQALVGGGSKSATPGEISLAHLGILFLDEIAEFSASTLDSLRQPMEAGKIVISRVGCSFEYPSRFTLVAAMNPCPCGYYGMDRCRCTDVQVRKYQSKLSGPILDRIDLQVDIVPLTTEERFQEEDNNLTRDFRKRVEIARTRQDNRFTGTTIPYNAAIPGGMIKEYCCFSTGGFTRYREVIDGNTLSTRSMDRLAKVARTIADLFNADEVELMHIDKAATYVIGGSLRSPLR